MNTTCPVCGESLAGKTGTIDFQYMGESVSFCGLTCLRVFQQFPEIYKPQSANEVPELTIEDSSA